MNYLEVVGSAIEIFSYILLLMLSVMTIRAARKKEVRHIVYRRFTKSRGGNN